MVKLLVFLGNPGRAYEKTRHNVGWMVCEHTFPSVSWSQKFNGLTAQEAGLRLLKPHTYMNESGKSLRSCMDFYQYAAEEVLVVHDDLELPFGTVKMQKGGGLQGHNGLKSIKNHIKDDQFIRLRLGIGRPKHGSVSSFVLQRFSPEEEISLPLILESAKSFLIDIPSLLPVTNTLV
ncbi:MAG: aminoacyl-tRNA hydrolase [Sphaerochaeta sp.]